MHKISSPSGQEQAKSALLLAIAHGLATGEHWWLWSQKSRNYCRAAFPTRGVRGIKKWDSPTPTNLAEVAVAHKRLVIEAASDPAVIPPRVSFHGSTMIWKPVNESLYSDRKVVIRVEDGADNGTIWWNNGKQNGEPSAFLASILVLLPGTEDDGSVAVYMTACDLWEARHLAALRQAKAAGLAWVLVEGDLFPCNTARADEPLHLGNAPRRSFTSEGQERRFARWHKPDERERLVANAAPLAWRAA